MTATLTEAYYRRLYAFQDPSPVIPLEEFFNPNHDPADGKFTTGPRNKKIGTGPKGGKIWTGVSADPDNRVKPKSKVHFPLEPDDYESPAEARVRFATQVFDADLGNGYQARVAGVREIHNGIAVTIKIRKGHEEAGIATRELTIDGAGRLVAHHETFYIEPKHQGKGIADRLNAHAVAEYQRLGVDRIELHAGAEVGGYAWARQGFRIFEGDRKKFLNVQLNRMETQLLKPVLRPHAKRLKADTDALRNAIYAGEDVQPIHIASLGEKYARYTGRDNHGNEYPTWPGKSLLMGTTWLGQYYFDANRAVTAAATNLEHARLRSEDFYNHDLSAVRTEEIAKPGQNTSSDNETHYSRLLGNLARDAGHDGIVINTNRWGGVGGQQIVVFDPSTIKVTGSHPYARTASAELAEALACHDAACAPPPAGTGGSRPTGALQARRGVVPGYGQQARRDIHLAGVRVTYKPDYPDDHPDPGEVVWAKVRYQEDVNQSKDRPVLIIGRINGTDKLAAVQLTSNDRPGKDRHNVGPGSWDRLHRNSAVKLDQIIVIDPKDYRREGSTFGREKFEEVIGRLAAFHRTPVQIAAGATWVELYNQNHSPSDGRFTSGGGFRVITKAQARGDSRPVSDEEFQRLAETGRTQLEGYARNAKKINLTDEQWSQVKSGAYAEVRKPWGGATIDLHTGQELPQGVNAWAITVKSTKGKRTQSSISVHENATEEEFNAAMDQARKKFGYTLARESHYLGVFHDDANHRIDIDPVLVVRRHADVETIGAATHAIGGAYNFRDGLGYWPPHVDTSSAATNKRDDYVRTYD